MTLLRMLRLVVGCCAGMLPITSHCAAQVQGVQLIRLRGPGAELQAYIAPAHGADLAGLEVRHAGRWSELLYRGMDYHPTDGWTGKAPILWPAVGRNFPRAAGADGQGDDGLGWVLHGRVYPMPIHGFARDQAWRVVRRGACDGSAFVRLALSDDDRTPRLLSSLKPLTPISLSGYRQGQEWVRLQDRSGFAVVVAHSEDRRPGGIPVLFNLWGDLSHGYFAPEPWVGKQNSLATGDGAITLEPGGTYRWTIEVRAGTAAAAPAASMGAWPAPACLQ